MAAAEAQPEADEAAADPDEAPAEQHGLLLPLPPSPALPPLTAPGRWGCFHISIKRPSKLNSYGAFEGTCPFHRKNSTTGCKKIQVIRGPTLQDREDALLRTKFWCALAFTVKRQHEHVFEASACGNLDPEVVEAMRIDHGPEAGQVVPDSFFDEPHAAAHKRRRTGGTPVHSDDIIRAIAGARAAGAAGRAGAVTAVAAAPSRGRGHTAANWSLIFLGFGRLLLYVVWRSELISMSMCCLS